MQELGSKELSDLAIQSYGDMGISPGVPPIDDKFKPHTWQSLPGMRHPTGCTHRKNTHLCTDGNLLLLHGGDVHLWVQPEG